MDIIELPEKIMLGKEPDVIMTGGVWIAGGSIRSWFNGEETPDIDVFAKDEKSMNLFIQENQLKNLVSKSATTETYRRGGDIVQAIRLYYDSVENLLDSFDYTICQFAWDNDKIYSTMEAVVATLRKHLAVHKVQPGYEVDSLRRAFKYFDKGYKPCLGTLQGLALSFSGIEKEVINKQVELSPGGGKRIVKWD